MAYIHQISESEATGLLKKIYEMAIDRVGKVANIIKVMSLDVPTVQTSMKFYLSLMKSDNALDAARREMIATVVSNANDCYY